MDEELSSRSEIEGLLFNIADITAVLTRIEVLLQEEEEGGEEGDEGGA